MRIELPFARVTTGSEATLPVAVINGRSAGPNIWLSAAIHGDELNGLPILLGLRERISPDDLSGMIVMLPVVNPYGFERQTRYLPDRRDLNRYFPGNARGSLANRIAHRIFENFVKPSDYLIDFHTAAGDRSNAPHVRADPASPEARALAQGFGGIVVLQPATPHTLRHAATAAGVPTAVFEGGENGRLDAKSIESGIRGVENVLASLGMIAGAERNPARPLWMTYSPWIRANNGGIVELAVGLGDLVQENQLLLTIRERDEAPHVVAAGKLRLLHEYRCLPQDDRVFFRERDIEQHIPLLHEDVQEIVCVTRGRGVAHAGGQCRADVAQR